MSPNKPAEEFERAHALLGAGKLDNKATALKRFGRHVEAAVSPVGCMASRAGRRMGLSLAAALLVLHVMGRGEGDPAHWCRHGTFHGESESFRLAAITGAKGDRTHFYEDIREECPGNEGCRSKRYLIPGDKVIVSRIWRKWACCWFAPARGSETVGWIAVDKLAFLEAAPCPGPDEWLGEWRYDENTITIRCGKDPGDLDVVGQAFWRGLGDNIHIGDIKGSARPDNGALRLEEGEAGDYSSCRVGMRLLGRFLIVTDNLSCGGANVSFSGVYQRNP